MCTKKANARQMNTWKKEVFWCAATTMTASGHYGWYKILRLHAWKIKHICLLGSACMHSWPHWILLLLQRMAVAQSYRSRGREQRERQRSYGQKRAFALEMSLSLSLCRGALNKLTKRTRIRWSWCTKSKRNSFISSEFFMVTFVLFLNE